MTSGLISKASTTSQDGKLKKIPGFTDTGRRGDEVPIFFSSPLLATGAATAVGRQVAPCDLTIVGATLKRPAAVATGKVLSIGTATSATTFLNKYALPTALGVTVLSATVFATTSIAQGDIISFSSTLITSATVAITLVTVPRNA